MKVKENEKKKEVFSLLFFLNYKNNFKGHIYIEIPDFSENDLS